MNPNSNATWTPEMQAELAAIRGDVRRAISTHQQGKFQHILTAVDKGVADLGENGAAFIVLWGCGRAVGMAFDTWGYPGWVDFWNGAGLFVGGTIIGARVVLDQLLGELIEFAQSRRIAKLDDEPEPPISTPVKKPARENGLEIDLPNGYQILLENVRAGIVLAMVKATAQEYFRFGGRDKNFSKNQLGRPWGEHLPAAKNQLGAIGYLEDAPNGTMKFTKAGAEWLEQFFQGAQ